MKVNIQWFYRASEIRSRIGTWVQLDPYSWATNLLHWRALDLFLLVCLDLNEIALNGIDGHLEEVRGSFYRGHQASYGPMNPWQRQIWALVMNRPWAMAEMDSLRRWGTDLHSGDRPVDPIGRPAYRWGRPASPYDRWASPSSGGAWTPSWVDFCRFRGLDHLLMLVCSFGVYDGGPRTIF
jgi:hypothetical protein